MSLKVKLLDLEFENPLLPAAGPNVGSLKSLKFFNKSKIGGIVTKTISVKGAIVSKPCIIGNEFLVHNIESWSELPLEMWSEEILPSLKTELKKPLIVSAGYTSEDFKIIIPKLNGFADFYEVSTHYGLDGLRNLVTTICSLTEKPVFIKLSPHIGNYIEFVKIAIECGAKGIVAINSLGPGVCINLEKKAVTIGMNDGVSWVSGPAIKPIALHRVATIRKEFPDIAIIAAGGVENATDVLEFILAGADLVQMLSAALIKGRQLYDEIIDELPKKMKEYNINSIEELRKEKLSLKSKGKGGYPIINDDCILCKRCIKICPEIAMSLDNHIINDKESCIRCGLCESRCPVNAISGVL